jgi:hypothetical protein
MFFNYNTLVLKLKHKIINPKNYGPNWDCRFAQCRQINII